MKTKTLRKNKVNVITLGCSKNIYDSEVLMGQLKANAIPVEHENPKSDANIVVINTCGFIDNAKQESIDTIVRYAEERKKGNIDKLYVTGCLSERYKPELEKEIKDVDSFFGTRDLPRLLKALKADYKHELVGERLLTTPSHYAFLKISEGCDRVCSFCAIPLMRGGHISIPIETLVQQAASLAANGVKELILIAQDLTYYGFDLYKKRNLAELLNALSEVKGIDWIRLHYAFPSGFPMDVLDVIRDRESVCKYLDMPLQHVSDRVLKSMRRGMNKEKTIALVNEIRQRIPGITMRTTMLVGYPGETDAEFEELKEFVSMMKFERLGVFTYSHEENTHAHTLIDDVPQEVKQQRAEELMELQQSISHEINQKKIGSKLKVLVDKKEGNFYTGRTEADSPEVDNEVLIDASKHFLRIGDYVDVIVRSADEFDLHAEPLL